MGEGVSAIRGVEEPESVSGALSDGVSGDSGILSSYRVSLADKYDLSVERIFVSGPQAIVRLLLMQKELDRRAGLDTAGFVSGYPGSPLGGLDHALSRAKSVLEEASIRFQPGLNEDLAATAVWGSQQAEIRAEGRYDGVFGLWYGKGPGVDRSGDALRHANLAGSSRHGGVLALMGDDHGAESSTTAHQSDFAFIDAMIPVLAPSGVGELIDYGLLGFALSRYSGAWVGLKCLKDTVEATASITAPLDRERPILPDLLLPPDGLNIRARDPVLAQEKRLHGAKRAAILAFVKANGLNRIIVSGGAAPRIGVAAAGKTWLDVRQALDLLGLDDAGAEALGLRLLKVGCVYPLEPAIARDFAQGLDLVMVVEEKRALIETQLREALYRAPSQPLMIGKEDEEGRPLYPAAGVIEADQLALALGRRLLRLCDDKSRDGLQQSQLPADLVERVRARVTALEAAQARQGALAAFPARQPYFCAGCPHNSSTLVPEGMRAYAGIGCHYMAQAMDRATDGFTQMGGEGANWVGEAPFSTRTHVLQNLGDGTYHHSGLLAIRFAAAAGANVTYKILYNDAIAMTGGQRLEGGLGVDQLARQLAAENVARIILVSDEPKKYPVGLQWPPGLKILPRDKLEDAQRELAAVPGVTALIYDETCASEKRRRRKRGEMAPPASRVIINELVCEGCGDCGLASNCVAIQPLETEFGRKRRIDASSCNTDLSCLEGFCPALVTVEGARLKKPALPSYAGREPPPPIRASVAALSRPYGVLIAGAGGTGVVTLAAILGMAAHLEGKGFGAIDMAGLAQKGGAVTSHVRIAARPDDVAAIRVGPGEADLLIGCDLMVAASAAVRGAIKAGETGIVVNTAEVYPGEFTRDPDFAVPAAAMRQAIADAAGGEAGSGTTQFFDASAAAAALFGDAVAANMLLLGAAFQNGLLPLGEASLKRAIELNGEAVEANLAAFDWGRCATADPEGFAAALAALRPRAAPGREKAQTLDEAISIRAAFLTDYQNEAYARRYAGAIARMRVAEADMIAAKTIAHEAIADGELIVTRAAAQSLFRLMAVKDEYEVARLYSDGSFARQAAAEFDGELAFTFHLAAPFPRRTSRAKAGDMGRGRLMSLASKGGVIGRRLEEAFGRAAGAARGGLVSLAGDMSLTSYMSHFGLAGSGAGGQGMAARIAAAASAKARAAAKLIGMGAVEFAASGEAQIAPSRAQGLAQTAAGGKNAAFAASTRGQIETATRNVKRRFGPWLMPVFKALARLKVLRGTPFDPFAWPPERRRERRMEQKLLADYEALLGEIAAALSPSLSSGAHAIAAELAAKAGQIRGFGHVKQKSAAKAKEEEKILLERFRRSSHASTGDKPRPNAIDGGAE